MKIKSKSLEVDSLSAEGMEIFFGCCIGMFHRGDTSRDWLIDILGEWIYDKGCKVSVYKIKPASHTVCRCEPEGRTMASSILIDHHYRCMASHDADRVNCAFNGETAWIPRALENFRPSPGTSGFWKPRGAIP